MADKGTEGWKKRKGGGRGREEGKEDKEPISQDRPAGKLKEGKMDGGERYSELRGRARRSRGKNTGRREGEIRKEEENNGGGGRKRNKDEKKRNEEIREENIFISNSNKTY